MVLVIPNPHYRKWHPVTRTDVNVRAKHTRPAPQAEAVKGGFSGQILLQFQQSISNTDASRTNYHE